MTDRVDAITELCQAWVDRIVKSDGSVVINVGAKGNPLSAAGMYPHAMTHAELRASCLGLLNILSIPNYQMIGIDDRLYWGWCAQVLDVGYGYFQPRSPADIELRHVFMAMAHASLADPLIVLPYEQDPAKLQALPVPALQALALILDHSTVSAYLCFPLLEGLLRKTLTEFVNRDGTVVKDFSVAGTHYGPAKRNRCNSVAHMLFQLDSSEQQKDTRLYSDLLTAQRHLQRADPKQHPYDLIHYWRNSSLHGNVSLALIGARVFNIVTLIALHYLVDLHEQPIDYEVLADAARRAALQGSSGERWSYYPRELIQS